MVKKRRQERNSITPVPPKTIGELRKRLSELGNPWLPDPKLSDDEPIPTFPTGGDGTTKPIGKVLPKGGVIDFFKIHPPPNPYLREIWKERGLLEKSVKPMQRRTTSRQPRGSG